MVWLISRCETVFADYLTNSKIFQKCSSLFLALCICHHPATPWCDFSQQRYIDYIDHVGQLSDSKKLLHHFGKESRKRAVTLSTKTAFLHPQSWQKLPVHTFNFFSILLPMVQLTKILGHTKTKSQKCCQNCFHNKLAF